MDPARIRRRAGDSRELDLRTHGVTHGTSVRREYEPMTWLAAEMDETRATTRYRSTGAAIG